MGLNSRVLLIVGLATACSTFAAYAQTADEVIGNMRRCASEQDDARRLSCYDREFRRTSAALGAPAHAAPGVAAPGVAATGATTSGAAVPGLAGPAQPVPSGGQSASLSAGSSNQPAEINKLTGRVVAISRKPQGQAIITLDNGQVWEQTDADGQAIPKSGDQISIQRGMLGGFYLLSPAAAFRVQQVK